MYYPIRKVRPIHVPQRKDFDETVPLWPGVHSNQIPGLMRGVLTQEEKEARFLEVTQDFAITISSKQVGKQKIVA